MGTQKLSIQPKRLDQFAPVHQPPFPALIGIDEMKRITELIARAGGISDRRRDARIVKRKRLTVPFWFAATTWCFWIE